MVKADEVRHPDEVEDDFDWAALTDHGHLDAATRKTIRLAHQAALKFPGWARKYHYPLEMSLVSSGVVLAAIALVRKTRGGLSPEKALRVLTQADLEASAQVASRYQRWRRVLRGINKRRKGRKGEG